MIGLPVLMPAMGGVHCAECGPAAPVGAMCLAILAGAMALAAVASQRLRSTAARHRGLLRAAVHERPPQLARIA